MSLNLTIPVTGAPPLSVGLNPGDAVFVLGSNGSGKSSLMQYLNNSNEGRVERILAHRQTWFSEPTVSLSSASFASTQTTVRSYDSYAQTRWKDPYASARSEVLLYRLIESHNNRARSIAEAADQGNDALVRERVQADAPLPLVNRLLKASNLPIKVLLDESGSLVVRKGDSTFSYAMLSDGERNALLVMSSVLTAPSDTLFLIDEPERHLHRSIIRPLLTQLFAYRKDCYFLVSTHEILLPLDHQPSRSLLVRSITFNGESPESWEIDLVNSDTPIDETVQKDILGARRTILFVEGEQGSLDVALYSILFPWTSVVPKSTSRDVEQAVRGIRNTGELHWVKAYGIVDNDNRPIDELAALPREGIYPLSVYSVESVYYHPDIIERVAARLAAAHGFELVVAITQATEGILAAVSREATRLAARVAERQAREAVFRHLPTVKTVISGTPVAVHVDTAALLDSEQAHLQGLISAQDVRAIVARYPIRETQAFKAVAMAMGLKDRFGYESAVRTLLLDDEAARAQAQALFGSLSADLAPA